MKNLLSYISLLSIMSTNLTQPSQKQSRLSTQSHQNSRSKDEASFTVTAIYQSTPAEKPFPPSYDATQQAKVTFPLPRSVQKKMNNGTNPDAQPFFHLPTYDETVKK